MVNGNNFSVFIKFEYVLYCFSCVVYSRLKTFGENREYKSHGKNKSLYSSVWGHINSYTLQRTALEHLSREKHLLRKA